MRVAELTGALLDYWTARAEGLPADELEIRPVQRPDPRTPDAICVLPGTERHGYGAKRLDYSTNWALCGPLVEQKRIELTTYEDPDEWLAILQQGDREFGPTAMIAICRAVVRAAFGDEVEDLP